MNLNEIFNIDDKRSISIYNILEQLFDLPHTDKFYDKKSKLLPRVLYHFVFFDNKNYEIVTNSISKSKRNINVEEEFIKSIRKSVFRKELLEAINSKNDLKYNCLFYEIAFPWFTTGETSYVGPNLNRITNGTTQSYISYLFSYIDFEKLCELLEIYCENKPETKYDIDYIFNSIGTYRIGYGVYEDLCKEKRKYCTKTSEKLAFCIIISIMKQKDLFPYINQYFTSKEEKTKIEDFSLFDEVHKDIVKFKEEVIGIDLPIFYQIREEYIENIKKTLLSASNTTIIINGVGGVGKTTTAISLYNYFLNQHIYNRIGWIEFNNNLDDSILASLDIDKSIKKPRNELLHLIHDDLLSNSSAKTLLFIDDASLDSFNNENGILSINSLHKENNIDLIITTRVAKQDHKIIDDSYTWMELKCLYDDTEEEINNSKKQAVTLFKHYYSLQSLSHEDVLAIHNIIELVHYNYLAIEVIAKVASQVVLDEDISLMDYFHIISNNNNIINIPNKKIISLYSKKEEMDVNTILQNVYKTSSLTNEEKKVIWEFAILPNIYIRKKNLNTILCCDNKIVENLYAKGWLKYIAKKGYQMHDIIKTMLWFTLEKKESSKNTFNDDNSFYSFSYQNKNSLFAPDYIYDNLRSKNQWDSIFTDNDTFDEIINKIEILKACNKRMKLSNEENLHLIWAIAYHLFYDLGYKHESEEFYSLLDNEAFLDAMMRSYDVEYHKTLSIIYFERAYLLSSMGNNKIEDAIVFSRQSLQYCKDSSNFIFELSHTNLLQKNSSLEDIICIDISFGIKKLIRDSFEADSNIPLVYKKDYQELTKNNMYSFFEFLVNNQTINYSSDTDFPFLAGDIITGILNNEINDISLSEMINLSVNKSKKIINRIKSGNYIDDLKKYFNIEDKYHEIDSPIFANIGHCRLYSRILDHFGYILTLYSTKKHKVAEKYLLISYKIRQWLFAINNVSNGQSYDSLFSHFHNSFNIKDNKLINSLQDKKDECNLIESLKKIANYSITKDIQDLATTEDNLGYLFMNLGYNYYEKAFLLLNKALNKRRFIENNEYSKHRSELSWTLTNLGELETLLGGESNLISAENHILESIKIRKEINSECNGKYRDNIAWSFLCLSNCYKKMKKHEKTELYFNLAVDLYKELSLENEQYKEDLEFIFFQKKNNNYNPIVSNQTHISKCALNYTNNIIKSSYKPLIHTS